MKTKLLNGADARTYAIVMEQGDEAMSMLESFATEKSLKGGHFTAIGAFESAVIAYFDWQTKDYKEIPVDEQVEVLSMSGDIAIKDNSPQVHAHVVLGRCDGSTMGGHLMKGYVRPTLEVILTDSPSHIKKHIDEESGLALIDL